MGLEVRGAVPRGRPTGAELPHLSPQLVRDPQRLQRAAHASDLGPVGVLGLPDSRPVAIEKGAQASRNHGVLIVPRHRPCGPLCAVHSGLSQPTVETRSHKRLEADPIAP